jgi:hypothetical protein
MKSEQGWLQKDHLSFHTRRELGNKITRVPSEGLEA